MLKSAIYLRVSTEDQAKQYSLSVQKKELKALAKTRGFQITQIYTEKGVSGESIAIRPQILQLLANAESGEFQYLLIVALDRLSRNLKDAIYLREKLQDAGVTIATPSQEFQHDSIDHDFTANIWGTIADYERKLIRERCQKGRIEKRRRGGWLGGRPPIGYQYDPTTKRLILDPSKSKLVESILKESIRLSPYHLSIELSNQGMTITPRQIRRMIEHNKVLFYNGRIKDYDGNIVKAEWPAIISDELADKILNAKRKRRTVAPDSTRAKFLLTGLGLFKCRFCGNTVKTFKSKKYKTKPKTTYYRCSSIQKGSLCKNTKMRPVEIIEMPVWKIVRSIIDDIFDIERAYYEDREDQLKDKRINKLKEKLTSIGKRKTRIISAVESGALSIDEVSIRIDELRKDEFQTHAKIQELIEPETIDLEALKKMYEKIDLDELLTFEEQRHIISLICEKIELGKASIYLKFRTPILKNGSSEVRIQIA